MTKLWDVAWDFWDHQNGAFHNSLAAQQQIIESHINEHLCGLYALGLQTVPWDAMHFFKTPVEQPLQLPTMSKQQWIESVELAQQHNQVHEFGWYATEQWFMQAYLIPQ